MVSAAIDQLTGVVMRKATSSWQCGLSAVKLRTRCGELSGRAATKLRSAQRPTIPSDNLEDENLLLQHAISAKAMRFRFLPGRTCHSG
jgi:hypothetical protein